MPNALKSALFSALVLLIAVAGCSKPQGHGSLPVLTTVAQVQRLSPAEAKCGYPVRIRGLVTVYDPAWRLLAVQDSTGGIAVDTATTGLDGGRGTEVEVEGYTAWEGDSLVVI